jgi:dynein heavy chain
MHTYRTQRAKPQDVSRHYARGEDFFVTPSHFLDLLDNFHTIWDSTVAGIQQRRGKYLKGLNKLDETSRTVDELRLNLEHLQPQLEVSSVETSRLMVILKKEEKIAQLQREVVDREASVCAETAQVSQALKDECEADLAKALPLLEDALSALELLNKNDVYEIKSMKSPPVGVKMTMEAIGILMKVKPDRVLSKLDGSRTEDYWMPAKRTLLADVQLLDKLKKFDKDNISAAVFAKVSPYCVKEQFQPRVITRQSKAAGGMCKWVHAIVTYSQISSLIEPKKDKLAIANLELEKATSALEVKQVQLKNAEDKVKGLQDEFQVALHKREELQAKALECRQKIDRATRLMSSMEEEKGQWTEYGYEQTEKLKHGLGDALLTAGFISYLGILDGKWRAQRLKMWYSLFNANHINVQEVFSLVDVLGDAKQIRSDRDAKLPNDNISKENAIILRQTTKWPLMIDPQRQVKRWLQNLHKKLSCIRQAEFFVHSEFETRINTKNRRVLENAIQFGEAVLIEDTSAKIDSFFASLLAIGKHGTEEQTVTIGETVIRRDSMFKLYSPFPSFLSFLPLFLPFRSFFLSFFLSFLSSYLSAFLPSLPSLPSVPSLPSLPSFLS